ncbi:MAG TPA: hypothetical protein VGR07_06640, partial [Thermoanaerobaculia bacterium]|nr:hypothetical protein [Thermoanaerobaculia bacterium]
MGPPLCRAFDLALCARLDSDVERQESAETAEPREKLFGWNTFFSVGLIEGGNELSFLAGRKLHQRLIAASEDRYGRSLWQREALDNDLAANDGACRYLHGGDGTRLPGGGATTGPRSQRFRSQAPRPQWLLVLASGSG